MEKKNFVQDAMQEVESLLKNAFAAAMQQGKLPENELPAFTVEIPAETTHGDFASNAAMVITLRAGISYAEAIFI